MKESDSYESFLENYISKLKILLEMTKMCDIEEININEITSMVLAMKESAHTEDIILYLTANELLQQIDVSDRKISNFMYFVFNHSRLH